MFANSLLITAIIPHKMFKVTIYQGTIHRETCSKDPLFLLGSGMLAKHKAELTLLLKKKYFPCVFI